MSKIPIKVVSIVVTGIAAIIAMQASLLMFYQPRTPKSLK